MRNLSYICFQETGLQDVVQVDCQARINEMHRLGADMAIELFGLH